MINHTQCLLSKRKHRQTTDRGVILHGVEQGPVLKCGSTGLRIRGGSCLLCSEGLSCQSMDRLPTSRPLPTWCEA